MNISFSRIFLTALALAVAVSFPFLTIHLTEKLLKPSDFQYVISEATLENGETISLPYIRFEPLKKSRVLKLRINIPKISDQNYDLYARASSSEIKIKKYPFQEIHSDAVEKVALVNYVPDRLLHLPDNFPQEGSQLDFSVSADYRGFLAISEIYIGKVGSFENTSFKHKLYYEKFRDFLVGALFLTATVWLTLTVSGTLGSESLSCGAIIVGLLGLGSGSLAYEGSILMHSHMFIVSLVPLLVFPYIDFTLGLRPISRGSLRWKLLMWNIAFVTVLQGAIWSFDIPLPFINMAISFPLFIATLFASLGISLYYFIVQQRKYSFIMTFATTTFLVSIFWDGLITTGFLERVNYVSGFCGATVLVAVSLIYADQQLRTLRQLEASTDVMNRSLSEQRAALESIHAQNLDRETRLAQNEEISRLSTDLHDGVLTYLTLINAISSKQRGEKWASIRAMSRYAVNEIRLVLTSSTYLKHGAPISLLAALSTLREQTSFALDQIGTQNTWRISALHRVTAADPRICLEMSRIMQEAIHNATVRGKATTLLITAHVIDNQRVELTVRNEGGKAIELPMTHMRGIANMYVRAASIGAELNISSLPTGAVLSLVVPLGTNFMLDQEIAPTAGRFLANSTS